MINIILLGFFAIVIGAFLWQMWSDYSAMAPADKADWKSKLWALGKGSATKTWQRFVGIIASALGLLASFADTLQLPQVSDAINKYMNPQYVSGALLVIAVVGVWARNRSLAPDKQSLL